MYTAPLLALGLVALLGYRKGMKALEKRFSKVSDDKTRALLGVDESPGGSSKSRRFWVLIFHYYTPLYLVLAWLTFEELRDGLGLLSRTDWLEPHKLREQFAGEDLPSWHRQELQYTLGYAEHNQWLSVLLLWLSRITPFCLIATFVITWHNTYKHVQKVAALGGGINKHCGHDCAILIIALPLVYSLMATKSVGRMWQISANAKSGNLADIVDFEGKHSWLARLVMCQLMYETNFMIADVYETLALFEFAWLTLGVIATQKLKIKSKGHIDVERQELSTSQQQISSLTMQGIWLFIITCLLQAVYYLFTTSVEFYVGAPALDFTMGVQRVKEKVHFFFLGCGTIASSAAIGNVVTIESGFHGLLEDFAPFGKFLSTKILVSFAFLQSLILYLPPFSTMSVTEGNLFYSSLISVECFGVCLLNARVWKPDESWYADLIQYVQVQEKMSERAGNRKH